MPTAIVGRLIFVRHGESIANAEHRFTHGPHEGLSELGRREAGARGRHLVKSARPAALYTSPFVRAQQTAALIGSLLGLEARVVEDLREQHFGTLRGRPYSALSDAIEPHGLARWEYRPPEGETLRAVAERVGPAVRSLATQHPCDEIVVVSHGGVMAALRGWLGGGYTAAPVLSGNAGGFWLDYERGAFGAAHPIETIETTEREVARRSQ